MGQRLWWCVSVVLAVACNSSASADCPQTQPALLLQPNPGGYVALGAALAADDETIAITDRLYDGGSPGAITVFRRQGESWTQEALLLPPTGTGEFGSWLDVSGSRLFAIGYRFPSPIVHIYERSEGQGGTTWVRRVSQSVPMMGTDPNCSTRASAGAIRVSRDEVLVVPGSVRCDQSVLLRIVEAPTLHLEFVASLPIPHLTHNEAPAASIDFKGDTVVVERRVYRRTDGVWQLEAQLPALIGPTREGRTIAVSLDADGNAVALGNNWEPGSGVVGYVQVYRRTPTGVWVHEVTLEHPNSVDPANNPGYGLSVALLGDRLAVGSVKDDFSGPDAGAVFLYERINGVWQGRGSTGPTDAPGAWAGFNLQMTPTRIIAGAIGLDGIGGGVVFDACSIVGPGGNTPRCLPGVLGLMTYLPAYFAGDSFADYDLSGSVSIQDFFDFIGDWFAGCP